MSVFFGRKLTNLINISSDPSNDDQSGKELNLEIRPSITSCKIGLFWTPTPLVTLFFFSYQAHIRLLPEEETHGGGVNPLPQRG